MMIKAKQRFSLLLLTALFLIFLLSGCVSSSSGTTNSVASEEASKPIATIFADYIPVTFDDLLKKSKFIVYGEVFHVLPARERLVAKTSTQVYTPIGIIPIQTLKGNPPSPFIYNYIGGEVEGIVHQIDGDKRSFQEGDHVLVFLSKYSGDIGRASVFIEHNGMLTVWDDEGNYTPVEVSTQEYIAKVKEALAKKGLS